MKTIHTRFVFTSAILQILCLLAFVVTPIAAQSNQTQKTDTAIERIEFEFERAPLLEVELTKYLTSDVHKPRTFEVTATLLEPLRTESGLVILPAQTKLQLKAHVRPGKYFGHPGEIVMWLDPFPIGKGIEGFACEAAAESTTANGAPGSGALPGAGKLHPLICQNTWRMAFDHQLDYAATPEAGRPLVLERKRRHEGISGTRASKPPNMFYDPSGSNADIRVQTAANRFQLAGIVYELGAAFTGAVRFVFSKRNVFLPAGTRVVFQLEHKLRLVPATDAPVHILRVNERGKQNEVLNLNQ